VGWPGGRLTIVDPFGVSSLSTTDDEEVVGIWRGRTDGAVDHGTDWSAEVVGDRLVIGVPDANGVYVEAISEPGTVGATPRIEGERRFGEVVRTVTTDGATTLFVGAPGADLDRGALYRFPDFGSRLEGDPADPIEPDLVIRGMTPNDRLGAELEVCGDIDGDGVLDLALGVPNFGAVDDCGMAEAPPPNLAGAVYVLRSRELAGRSGELSICDVALDVLWGTELGEQAGAAVACTPGALYVGAPWRGLQGDEDQNRGVVYRVPWIALPAAGPLPELGTALPGPSRESGYGLAIASLSLEGRNGVLVGAPGYATDDGARRGRVELLLESKDAGLDTVATVEGVEAGEQFGRTVLAADLDDDGTDDVVLGSPDVRIDERFDVGRLWLWRSDVVEGWAGGVDRATADQIIEGSHAFQRAGRKLSRTTLQGTSVLLIPTRAPDSTR